MIKKGKISYLITILFFLSILMLLINPTSVNASPSTQEEGPVYVVQDGDTLNSIALRFGVALEDIQAANDLPDPNAIIINQRLVIPGLEGISGLLTSEVLSYGTSLTALAREYRINHQDLVTLNHLISPSEAIAGIKFIVAVSEEEVELSPITSVAQGETPLEKAIQTGVSPWQLVENNQLEATWDMLPGEKLFGQKQEDAENSSVAYINLLTVNPIPAVQGETLEVSITTYKPVEISGTFDGKPLQFFTEDNENYHCFAGIHAMADIGPVPLKITITNVDGTTQTHEQMVLIASGNYGNDAMILVDDIYVDPETIAEEDEIINNVLTQYTIERYWEGKFQYPIDEPFINGYFGQRRNYNDGAFYYYHTGIDFEVRAPNLNIYAPAAGKVVLTEEMVVRGNAILIDHGWGVYSGYWHLAEFNVEVGDYVQPGDLLGIIGNTGRSLGPHLHFEIDIGGTPVNPETWLNQVFP
jgi:murein DD-endopeptidase MepM/ murein hydrolase activator NlpD